jgi:hypothetical protein
MKKDSSAYDLMDEIDFPHRRDGGVWRSTRPALASPGEVFDCYNQTVKAIKVMRKHGVSDESIVKIVHDLYWAAVTEKHLDDTARLYAKAKKFLGELQSLRNPGATEALAGQAGRTVTDPPAPEDAPICPKCGVQETPGGVRCEHC